MKVILILYHHLVKKKIENIYKTVTIVDNDSNKLALVFSLSLHPKKVIIEDFLKHTEEIYKIIFSNLPEDILIQMNTFLKKYNNNIMEIDLLKLSYSLQIYIPSELRNILKKILKDKMIKENSIKISKCHNNIANLIATYGIISIKDLCKIYSRIYEKINKNNIINSILINRTIDDSLNLVKLDDDYLVYGIEFEDEDEALSFYYSLSQNRLQNIY